MFFNPRHIESLDATFGQGKQLGEPLPTVIAHPALATNGNLPRVWVERGAEILDGELGVAPPPATRRAVVFSPLFNELPCGQNRLWA
jgi:hypothetical protein